LTRRRTTGVGGRVVDLHLAVTLPGRALYWVIVREMVTPAAEPCVGAGSTTHVQANSSNPQQVVAQLPR